MPSFKDIRCSIEIGKHDAKLPEYCVDYTELAASTFVVVPEKPTTFSIHLQTDAHVAEGLLALVWIDGVYQGNKGATGLRPPSKSSRGVPADIRIRQKCIPEGKTGHFKGSQWIFNPLKIVAAENDMNLRPEVMDELGCIVVMVLRCAPTNTGSSQYDGAGDAADKTPSIGGSFSMFDGANDEMDQNFQFPTQAQIDGHYSPYQHRRTLYTNGLPTPHVTTDDNDDEVTRAREALRRAEAKQSQRRYGRDKKYSITHNDLMNVVDEACRRSWQQYASLQQTNAPYQPTYAPAAYGHSQAYRPFPDTQVPFSQQGPFNQPISYNQLAHSPPPDSRANPNPGPHVGWDLQAGANNAGGFTSHQQPAGRGPNGEAQDTGGVDNSFKGWQAAAQVQKDSRNATGGRASMNWNPDPRQGQVSGNTNEAPRWDNGDNPAASENKGHAGWNLLPTQTVWPESSKHRQAQSNVANNSIRSGGGNDPGANENNWSTGDDAQKTGTQGDWAGGKPTTGKGDTAGWDIGGDNTKAWGNADKKDTGNSATIGGWDNADKNDTGNGATTGDWNQTDKNHSGNGAATGGWDDADKKDTGIGTTAGGWDNTNSNSAPVVDAGWANAASNDVQGKDDNWATTTTPNQQINNNNWNTKAPSKEAAEKAEVSKTAKSKQKRHKARSEKQNVPSSSSRLGPGFETTYYNTIEPKPGRKSAIHPALTVPDNIPAVKDACADTYVAAADYVDYVHSVKRLEYIDSKERPYVIFKFYYRTEKALKKLRPKLDLTPKQDDDEVQRIVSKMSRLELEKELLKTKGISVPGDWSDSDSEESDSDADDDDSSADSIQVKVGVAGKDSKVKETPAAWGNAGGNTIGDANEWDDARWA